jgi:hypothetical protein
VLKCKLTDDRPFIVAELSKNWDRGLPVADTGLLSEQFEVVIETNRRRGYRLVTFELDRMVVGDGHINETIIAVFERIKEKADS